MAINLELRHLWTRTGGPLTWRFDDEDDRELRDLLRRLDAYKADPSKRSAVLLATETTERSSVRGTGTVRLRCKN